MGIRDWFRTDYPASYGQVEVGLRSPFLPASSHLAVVTAPGFPDNAVTEGMALGVPPVARAIDLFSSIIAGFDLKATEGETPAWCAQTDLTIGAEYEFSSVAITPANRWALVVQDLFFYNTSLLWKDDVDGDYRPVNGLSHVHRSRWNLDRDGFVLIDGARQDSRHLVLIQGLKRAGFLETAKTTINHYHALQEAILNRASHPTPLLDLHISDPNFQPDPSYIDEAGNKVEGEMEEIARVWGEARRSKNGAVAVSPHWLEVKPIGEGRMDMLTEARNAGRLDVANFANINAAMLDGNNGTSDTYSNTLQNTNELVKLSMPLWMKPIEARLSQNDVTAPDVKLAFDTSDFDTTDAKGNTGKAVAPAENGTPND